MILEKIDSPSISDEITMLSSRKEALHTLYEYWSIDQNID